MSVVTKNRLVARALSLVLAVEPLTPVAEAYARGLQDAARLRPLAFEFQFDEPGGGGLPASSGSVEGEAAPWTSTAAGVEVGPSSGPTFWVSEATVERTTIELTLRTPAAPSGRVGLSFGHRAPVNSIGRADADLLLLDWGPLADPTASGLALVRIVGAVGPEAFVLHQAEAGATVLAERPAFGWEPGRAYQVRVRYRPRRIDVAVNGQIVLEAVGDFDPGRVGFYASSAGGARFESLTLTPSDSAPVADAGPDQTVFTGGACQAPVVLDASGSVDPDGDLLGYEWSGAIGSLQGVRQSVALPVGRHEIALVVNDGTGHVDSDQTVVSVRDGSAPTVACPAPVEALTSPNRCDAPAAIAGVATASDACGLFSLTNDAPTLLPVGRTSITWTAIDASQQSSSCTQSVVVRDGQRPGLTVSVATAQLWPVNHTMIDVGLSFAAVDNCVGDLTRHVAVWSDEPDESPTGDGNHPGDASVVDGRLRLRAERKGNADGRVYLVLGTATDRAGNTATQCSTVTVPKSNSKAGRDSVLAQAAAARAHCALNGSAPSGFHLVGEGYVARPNQPPMVDAGPDGAATFPDAVFVTNGVATDDGLPNGEIGLTWSVVEEPAEGHVTFGDSSAAVTEARFDAPGTYVLRLTAFDGALSASDDVRVVVSRTNEAPVVEAGEDLEIRLPANAHLLGSVADDGLPEPAAVSVTWSVVSGTTGAGTCHQNTCGVTFARTNALETEASFAQAGSYVLRLTAADGELTVSDELTVTVRPVNLPPQVSTGPDQTVSLPEAFATLLGQASDDGEPGTGLTWDWSVVSAPVGGSVVFSAPGAAITEASFDVAGVYVLRLTVSDGLAMQSDEVVVTVLLPNQPPTADAGADMTLVLPANTTALQGVASDDGQPGGVLNFAWTFVDGPAAPVLSEPGSLATAVSFPPVPGAYLFRLTVSDGEFHASDQVTVTVEPPPLPTIQVEDGEVAEGPEGLREGSIRVRLDFAAAHAVSVEFATAGQGCGTVPTYGRLEFAPGEMEEIVAVRYLGDLLPEADEPIHVTFGSPAGALLPDGSATLVVRDDDEALPPLATPVSVAPADSSERTPTTLDLSWLPMAGARFDVRLGTSFSREGQTWLRSCAGGAGPSARQGAAFAYDEARDRLLVFGGRDAGGADLADVWALDHASGEGAAPTWRAISPTGTGPTPRRLASAAYDAERDRLIVFGGCSGSCEETSSEAFVLVGAAREASTWEACLLHRRAAQTWRLRIRRCGIDWSWHRRPVGARARRRQRDRPRRHGMSVPVAKAGPRACGGKRLTCTTPRATALRLGRSRRGGQVGAGFTPSRGDRDHARPGRTSRRPQDLSAGPGRARVRSRQGRLLLFGGTSDGIGDNFVFGDTWLLDGMGTGQAEWVAVGRPGPTAPPARFGAAAAFSPLRNRLVVVLGANDKGCQPGGTCSGNTTYFEDVAVLRNAAGELPLVAEGLADPQLAVGPLERDTLHHWKVVARDDRGVVASGPTWRFTPGLPLLEVADVVVNEGSGEPSVARFVLALSRPAAGGEMVTVATVAGTAEAGTDFQPVSLDVTFAAGDLQHVVEVPVVGDVEDEADEGFELHLSDPQGLDLARTAILATILDDDLPPNQAPEVSAGEDLFTALPDASVVLEATFSDDGLPPGVPPAAVWSVASVPPGGSVAFTDATSSSTSVSFDTPGEYVLRFTVDDGGLVGFDEVRVTVDPANAPPIVDAGTDVAVEVVAESLVNGGAESGLTSWTAVQGNWSTTPITSLAPAEGSRYFHMPGFQSAGELRQDVPLSAFATAIDAGEQRFEFRALFWAVETYADGRLVLEYRDAANVTVLAAFDTGYFRTPAAWTLVADSRLAPPGARFARVRLLARSFGNLVLWPGSSVT